MKIPSDDEILQAKKYIYERAIDPSRIEFFRNINFEDFESGKIKIPFTDPKWFWVPLWFALAASCGVRLQESIHIRVMDLLEKNGNLKPRFILPLAKKNSKMQIHSTAWLFKAIRLLGISEWESARFVLGNGYNILSTRTIQRRWDEVRKELNISTTCHDLRHYAISNFFAKSMNPEETRRFARHSDPRTTFNTYVHNQDPRQEVLMQI